MLLIREFDSVCGSEQVPAWFFQKGFETPFRMESDKNNR